VSRLCHLTSTSILTNCMLSHIPQLSMFNSSWSFLFPILPTEFLMEAPSPLVNRCQDCLHSLVDLPFNSDHMQSVYCSFHLLLASHYCGPLAGWPSMAAFNSSCLICSIIWSFPQYNNPTIQRNSIQSHF
jgi:hypothetical protein